jgi:RNA polymerase primary sigma factor
MPSALTNPRLQFISYAVWWIRQSILQLAEQSRIVRLPLNRVGSLNKKSANLFGTGAEVRAFAEEIAEVLELTTSGWWIP